MEEATDDGFGDAARWIWQVDFNPARGSEASKSRPAIVVSNDRANATASRLGCGVVTVVPVTSNIATTYPFQVFACRDDRSHGRLQGAGRADQIRCHRTTSPPDRPSLSG